MIQEKSISLPAAAVISGIGYLMMMGTPFAEFYALEKLVVNGNMSETASRLLADPTLFRHGIFAYTVNFTGDILATWGLYILLKPVSDHLSMLTAWLRLVYTVISLAALLNLVTILQLLNGNYASVMTPDQLALQIDLLLQAFRKGWNLGYIFFALHLWLLGYLVFKSGYIPKIIGILLIGAGTGWFVNSLKPLLYPDAQINFTIIMIAGTGELVFMFWLLIRGWKIPASRVSED